MTTTKLRPPEIAKRYHVDPNTVIGWIRAGELRAINIARRDARKPRFLIDVADLEAFEAGRAVVPRPKLGRPPRKRELPAGYVKYF